MYELHLKKLKKQMRQLIELLKSKDKLSGGPSGEQQ